LIGPIKSAIEARLVGKENNKMELEIKGFIETSFLDWDGKIVSTLYVAGCNFRCPFCHNAGLIEKPQEYETISLERIEKHLIKHRDFIDGICLTGGEPCLHHDRGLIRFMKRIKANGFMIKLDSNGTRPECLKNALNEKLVDYFAMDIKGPLDERYDRLTGVKTDLEKIKQSIAIIMGSGVEYEFRTTVVPTLIDVADVKDIVGHIAGADKYVLQQFAPDHSWDESFRKIEPHPREKLEEMAEAAKKEISNVIIRGI